MSGASWKTKAMNCLDIIAARERKIADLESQLAAARADVYEECAEHVHNWLPTAMGQLEQMLRKQAADARKVQAEGQQQLAATRDEAPEKELTYRCFYCGGVFNKQEAAVHFDIDEGLPLCLDFCSWDKNGQLRNFHNLSVELDVERDKVGELMQEVARLKRYSEIKQEMDCYGTWICWFQEEHDPQIIYYQDNGRWSENGCCIDDEEWFDTEGDYVGHVDFIGLQMVWYDDEANAARIRQGGGG